MATQLQKKALDRMVEKGRNGKKISVSGIMREVGYSPNTAVDPSKLTDSDGFKELCEEYGLTDGFLVKALVSDIKKKPKNRKAELELAFKVRGRLKEKEEPFRQQNNFLIFDNEQARKIAARIAGGSVIDDPVAGDKKPD